MKEKILITGVAGFIGSNLASQLLQKGYSIVGIDNLSQGDKLNIESFNNDSNFNFHDIDIRNEKDMLEVSSGCKKIVHLAAYKIPRYNDAVDTLMINGFGSDIVIKAAIKHKAKIVAASTSDIYGKNTSLPFSEESSSVIGSPEVKRWAYAISKLFEEQLLFAYHDREKIDIAIIRFFGGYGPNQNLTWWGGPQSVFIDKALDNEEIEVHGDGNQTRSFTYIDDHVDGIIRIVEKDEANNKVFNLGNTREISILNLAKLIWNLIRPGSEPKIKLKPYADFGKYEDVMRRIPDITKAREILGFEPQVDLEVGLKKTILWQIERRKKLGRVTMDVKF